MEAMNLPSVIEMVSLPMVKKSAEVEQVPVMEIVWGLSDLDAQEIRNSITSNKSVLIGFKLRWSASSELLN